MRRFFRREMTFLHRRYHREEMCHLQRYHHEHRQRQIRTLVHHYWRVEIPRWIPQALSSSNHGEICLSTALALQKSHRRSLTVRVSLFLFVCMTVSVSSDLCVSGSETPRLPPKPGRPPTTVFNFNTPPGPI